MYDDCKKYLEEYEGLFDVIVLDLADPVEAGPAFPIWTKEYYTTCTEKLSPDGARRAVNSQLLNPATAPLTAQTAVQFCLTDKCLERLLATGILVTQAGPFSVNQVHEICTPVAKTLESVFPTVLTYGAHIPSFGHSWAYNIAFKQPSSLDVRSPEDIDAAIQRKLGAEAAKKLGWYDGLTHRSMFSLPKPIRVALAAETRVVTMDTPLAFMAGEGVRELEAKL